MMDIDHVGVYHITVEVVRVRITAILAGGYPWDKGTVDYLTLYYEMRYGRVITGVPNTPC